LRQVPPDLLLLSPRLTVAHKKFIPKWRKVEN
jgi:hypothetical protein